MANRKVSELSIAISGKIDPSLSKRNWFIGANWSKEIRRVNEAMRTLNNILGRQGAPCRPTCPHF
jgi:hypothetical protein